MFTFLQILIIILFTHILDAISSNTQLVTKYAGMMVVRGAFVGLVMGDFRTGLLVGGTMQLMSMGLAPIGGASVPNYNIATIIGTAYAIATKSENPLEIAIAIGVPVATLGVQLDVIAKTANSFWYHLVQKDVEERNYKKAYRDIILGAYGFGKTFISNTLPVALFLIFGQPVVEFVVNNMPPQLIKALNTVAGVIPALGMASLCIYMPVKENFHWLIIGFVLSVYLGLDILPITLIGAVIGVVIFKHLQEKDQMVVVSGGMTEDE